MEVGSRNSRVVTAEAGHGHVIYAYCTGAIGHTINGIHHRHALHEVGVGAATHGGAGSSGHIIEQVAVEGITDAVALKHHGLRAGGCHQSDPNGGRIFNDRVVERVEIIPVDIIIQARCMVVALKDYIRNRNTTATGYGGAAVADTAHKGAIAQECNVERIPLVVGKACRQTDINPRSFIPNPETRIRAVAGKFNDRIAGYDIAAIHSSTPETCHASAGCCPGGGHIQFDGHTGGTCNIILASLGIVKSISLRLALQNRMFQAVATAKTCRNEPGGSKPVHIPCAGCLCSGQSRVGGEALRVVGLIRDVNTIVLNNITIGWRSDNKRGCNTHKECIHLVVPDGVPGVSGGRYAGDAFDLETVNRHAVGSDGHGGSTHDDGFRNARARARYPDVCAFNFQRLGHIDVLRPVPGGNFQRMPVERFRDIDRLRDGWVVGRQVHVFHATAVCKYHDVGGAGGGAAVAVGDGDGVDAGHPKCSRSERNRIRISIGVGKRAAPQVGIGWGWQWRTIRCGRIQVNRHGSTQRAVVGSHDGYRGRGGGCSRCRQKDTRGILTAQFLVIFGAIGYCEGIVYQFKRRVAHTAVAEGERQRVLPRKPVSSGEYRCKGEEIVGVKTVRQSNWISKSI